VKLDAGEFALSDMLGSDRLAVPQMEGANAPPAIAARMVPWAATISVVSWIAATVVGLVIFYFGLVMGSIVPWLALPLTIGGLIVAAFCLWQTWRAMRARKADAPVLQIGPDGYHDARLGRAIPWSEIVSLTPDQPGTRTYLKIVARDPARFVKRKRLARRPALVSSLSELDEDPAVLIASAEAHRRSA
jgi:hypothetical protein